MLGSEIIAKFINMVEDELDTTFMYQLLNDAKDEVESMREWELLKDEMTISATTTTLPTNFMFDVALLNSTYNYTKIKKQDRHYTDLSYAYYLDMLNNNIVVPNYSVEDLYFFYIVSSSDISESTEWAFPSRFHTILAYKMAQMYYAADAGEKARAWDDRWDKYYEDKLAQMELWDDKLKARNGRTLNQGERPLSLNI